MDDKEVERRLALAIPAFRGKMRTYARNTLRSAPTLDQGDVEAELLAVLWKACAVYDPNNGATFNTFAQRCFQNHCASLVRKVRAVRRNPKDGNQVLSLDVEAVQWAAEGVKAAASAEDEAILRMFGGQVIVQEQERRRNARLNRYRQARAG